jgi:ribosome-associated protein
MIKTPILLEFLLHCYIVNIKFNGSDCLKELTMIEITKEILIPEEQFVFRFSRSSGPGGQNVNKVNTAVTVYFDLAGSNSFSKQQKAVIAERFSHRINKAGQMRVVCQQFRSQIANRQAALERLIGLLRQGLAEKKSRKKTKIPFAAKARRLEDKKHHGQIKKQRSAKITSE